MPRILVVDLEATCSDDGSIPPEEMEIIEIGACWVTSISYWDAEYKFQATDPSGIYSSPDEVSWSYPVFVSDNGRKLNRLNAWIRRESLRSLVEPDQFDDVVRLSDSKLIQVIAGRFNGVDRSSATVSALAGRYLQIDLIDESIGAAHSSLGFSTLVYDLIEDKPVDLKRLLRWPNRMSPPGVVKQIPRAK